MPASALAVRLDYSTWGWLQLLMGLLMLAAGYGLLAGQAWARMTAVVLAGLSALANLTFVAAYPWWALTLIALDVVIIYAVSVHGAEARVVLTGSSASVGDDHPCRVMPCGCGPASVGGARTPGRSCDIPVVD